MGPEQVDLAGRVAVVTGGGAGIGRGIAETLARFGARVAIWEREPERGRQAATAIGASALAFEVDVREAEAVDGALARTCDEFGVPEILVNNAGGTFAAPFLESSPKGWAALHRANLEHVMLCTRAVATACREAGQGGSIINVASIEGRRAAPGFAAYAAAKAGVLNLTKSLAVELAPHGIRVNALTPDVCRSEGLDGLMGEGGYQSAARRIPQGRVGEPGDLGGAAVFLASDLSCYVTGAVIPVDGGTEAASGWVRSADGSGWNLPSGE